MLQIEVMEFGHWAYNSVRSLRVVAGSDAEAATTQLDPGGLLSPTRGTSTVTAHRTRLVLVV